MRRLIVVLALGAAAAGCTSSSVPGHGSPQPSSRSTSVAARPTRPAATGSPSSTAATSGSVPPVATPTSGPPPELGCPAGAVTARGAPFCYPLPRGFADFSAQGGYGSGWTYRTLVSAGGHDLVEVLGSVYPNGTDAMSATELRTFFDRSGRLVKGKLGIVAAGKVAATRVDGHRGFVQRGRYRNGVRTVDTRVYAGRTVVAIYCQSKARTPQVLRACTQIRRHISITHL